LSARPRRASARGANGAIEMLLFHREVFDEVITGTSTTWYSSAEHNALIGAADDLVVFAVATDVAGTTTLKVYVDTSGDNEHWYEPGTEKINATISDPNDSEKAGSVRLGVDALAAFARLRINLSGSGGPACRVKLTVTGRSG
jgi:hypothetical protein